MNIDVKEFVDLGLTPNAYFILYCLVHEDKELYEIVKNKIGNCTPYLEELERNLFLKKQNNTWISRQKLLSLRDQIKPEILFDKFWDEYHIITDQKKTDLQAALKYWKKLSKSEKQLAFDNIKPYFYSLPVYSTGRPVKKARTYLADKNFNDEFDYKEEKSTSKMI